MLPNYPVYIPSKGRANNCLTAEYFIEDKMPFYLVIEPQDYDVYHARFKNEPLVSILILPFSNLGQGSIPARNWIKEHATINGHKRHWQVDDNCRGIWRVYKGKRIRCPSGIGLRATEDLSDR
jgi:hypothetical protein